MGVKGVAHIAMCVSDLERSLRFYRDVLGMTVQLHTTQAMAMRPGASSQAMYDTSHVSRTVAHVWCDDPSMAGPFLVLTSHPGDQVSGKPIKLDQIGISHLSFVVDDLRGVADELVAKGVRIAGELKDFCDEQGCMRTFFVHDPDRILVQFEQAT
ncbi:MAG TPA: VOC family protein [Candidatus Tectomicrobia bacterium]|nr:VOC family protein [Candidatus Tectomicrobia bacterium]